MTVTYGTLNVVIGFPVRCIEKRRGATSPASSGFVAGRQLQTAVSRQSGQARTRSWELHIGPMGVSDRDSLLSSFDAAKAGALPILLTPPPPHDAAPIPVRLADSLTIEYVKSARAFQARVEAEEVI